MFDEINPLTMSIARNVQYLHKLYVRIKITWKTNSHYKDEALNKRLHLMHLVYMSDFFIINIYVYIGFIFKQADK